MAVNGTEQTTPSTLLQVTLEALFDHIHTIRVLWPLTLETISTALTHLIFQPISTASTHFILQPISTASTHFILQPISTASTLFIVQPISTVSTRFILQPISTTLTSKLISTAWTHLSLFLLNSLVIVCLLPRLTRQNFNQLKPFCTNSLNFIVSRK